METFNAPNSRDTVSGLSAGHSKGRRWFERKLFAWVCLLVLRVSVATPLMVTSLTAAEPSDYLSNQGHHPLYHRMLPPGGIWQSPAATAMAQAYYQPVAFSGPEGVQFSMAQHGSFAQPETRLMAGLMVGAVYRFRVTNIPGLAGAEVYPTVELIGRTYPPQGLETTYPIPINLSLTDLQDALEGRLVTRVVYLEDPQTALPLAQKPSNSRPIDIPLHQDALATADTNGRPLAIVRIGSMSPPEHAQLNDQFFFGHPSWAPIFQPQSESVATPNP